jgi:membrane protease YdiL (CAAX protease family)
LYHGALDAGAAAWLTLLAVTVFYTAAVLQRPGLPQLVIAQLALGATVLLVARLRRAPLTSLGLIAPRRRALLGAALVGACAWYPNLCLAKWTQEQLGAAERVAGLEHLLDRSSLAGPLICLTVFPALCEELAFRGLLARALAARHGLLLAVLITAPVFGAYHLSSAQLLPATLLGGVLAWSSLRGNSLWISICIHAINNAVAILATRGYLGPLGALLNERPLLAVPLALGVTATGLALVAAAGPAAEP